MTGKTVSHYRILEKLGGGGMGVVYKAEDLILGRTVALKFLPSEFTRNEDAKKRFIQEAKSASSLDHNNICVIHEISETDEGQLFICMNNYEGRTLEKIINSGPLPLSSAVDIAIHTAVGLQKAHENKIVHRDIKPANIFVTNEGIVKILDFGLAKLSNQTALTRLGDTLGTALYMSPEQTRGTEVDQRTDIWSLGVVLYEMVTGSVPFRGDYEQAVIYNILNEKPVPASTIRPEISAELDSIINRAIAKDPEKRYQEMGELIKDLRSYIEKPTEQHQVKPAGVKKKNFHFYKKYILAAIVIAFLAALAIVIKSIWSGNGTITEPTPIAVISFENQTGDNSYDYLQKAIPNLLISNLEQSKYFRVTTWERMNDLLNQMGKRDITVIDKELGFSLCQKENVNIIVIGSYIKAGNIFATDIKILDVNTKQLIKSVSSKGEGLGSILETQIDELSNEISKSIGISYAKITAEKMHILDVTTNSMEAYKYYILGKEDLDKFYFKEAVSNFEKALAIDSTFATAHLFLGFALNSLGETKKAAGSLEKAYLYSRKATEKERLLINAVYSNALEGNSEKGVSILNELVKKYPKEKTSYFLLGLYYKGKRIYEKAIENFSKVLELDPEFGLAVSEMFYTYSDLDDYEKAIFYLNRYLELNPNDANSFDAMGDYYWKTGKIDLAYENYIKAIQIKPDFPTTRSKMIYILFMKEKYDEGEIMIDQLIENSPSQSLKFKNYWISAFFNSWQGKIKSAYNDLNTVRKISRSFGNKYYEAAADWMQAFILFETGNLEEINSCYSKFIDYTRQNSPKNLVVRLVDYKCLMAEIDIKKNQLDSAKNKLVEVERMIPDLSKDDFMAFNRYDQLNAELMLAENSPLNAIAAFKKITYKIPKVFDYPDIIRYNLPFQKDELARAYYKAGQTDNAITEYKKLLKYDIHRNDRFLIHPKYHYKLGILLEEKGRKDEAVEQYKTFLRLWKEADKNLPEPIDAKKRLTYLQNNLSVKR